MVPSKLLRELSPIANSLKKPPSSRTASKMAQYCQHHDPPCMISPIHGGCADRSPPKYYQKRNIRSHSSGYTVKDLMPARGSEESRLGNFSSTRCPTDASPCMPIHLVDELREVRRPQSGPGPAQYKKSRPKYLVDVGETVNRGSQRRLEYRERELERTEESAPVERLTRQNLQP